MKEILICSRGGLLGVHPKSHKWPTSVRNEKTYEYISMDNIISMWIGKGL